jgi:hypothetical protein
MKIKHATPSPDRPDRTPTLLRPLPDPTHSRYRALEEFHS